MISGIYQITNLINNKIYIGSSIDIKYRWSDHKRRLKSNKHINLYLQNSWNKYGEENFSFEILLCCEDFELLYYEQFYLDNLNPEYNICKTAGNTLGKKHTEEAKRKMSDAMLGKYSGKNNPLYGVRKYGKENSFYGKTHTEETKRKLRAANFGRKHTEETKQRMSKAGKGRKFTEEHKRNMSGENKANSKLTEVEVLEIRRLYATGNYLQRELAEMFNVSRQTISAIVTRTSWRHI